MLLRFENNTIFEIIKICLFMWVPITTAWGVLGLRIEETASNVEGSLKYIE